LNPGVNEKVGYYFAYNAGTECTGGGRTPASPEAEGEAIAVSDHLTGLAPATEYAYCLVATNSFGETFGEALTFRTSAGVVTKQESPPAPVFSGPTVADLPVFGAPGAHERTKIWLAKRMRACGKMRTRRRLRCRGRARRRYEKATTLHSST